MQTLDDNQLLWNKFLKGDIDAFSKIYKINIQHLFQFGMCFTKDSSLIEDCIQDVFVCIYSKKSNLKHVDNVIGYLSISLRNRILDCLSKNGSNIISRLDDCNNLEEKSVHLITTFESDLFDEDAEIIDNRLHKIMEGLTVRQREIINYRFVQGLKVNEISALININSQSVSNILQRSLKRIRVLLKKEL